MDFIGLTTYVGLKEAAVLHMTGNKFVKGSRFININILIILQLVK